jgi:electron transfer flavoprotein beta subunit
MGCDEAIWLKDACWKELDSFGIAKVLAKGIRQMGNIDLVLCGRQAGDWDMGQVGPLIAGELSLPCVPLVYQINLEQDRLVLKREMDRGVEILEGRMPLLATITSASSNQPRYPTVKGLVLAGRKKIPIWSNQDLQITERIDRLVTVEDLIIPQYERQVRIIDGETGAEKATSLAKLLVEMKLLT